MGSFRSKYKAAFKISAIFLVLSAIYIIVSDYLILHFLSDSITPQALNQIQSYKGLAYVFIIAVILFALIQREINVARSYIRKLENKQKMLEQVTAEKDEIAKKFYTLFMLNPTPIVITRLQDGKILEVNDSYLQLFGYSRKDLLNRATTDLTIWENKEDRKQMFKTLTSEKTLDGFQAKALRKNGEVIDTQSYLQIVDIGNEKVIIAIILDITERVKTEKQIEEYQNSLKQMTMEISLAEEKQRKQIAANIHDHLSQLLVVSKIRIGELEKRLERGENKEDVAVINKYISEALEKSRKITYDLSPPVLYEMGLVETMHWLVEKINDEHGIEAFFHTEFEDLNLPESKLILIFRVIQELVHNAIKHARPDKLEISFANTNKNLKILISDDGKGFIVDGLTARKFQNGGFGLFAVRERINNLGGSFDINSNPGNGTEIKISVPLAVKPE